MTTVLVEIQFVPFVSKVTFKKKNFFFALHFHQTIAERKKVFKRELIAS